MLGINISKFTIVSAGYIASLKTLNLRCHELANSSDEPLGNRIFYTIKFNKSNENLEENKVTINKELLQIVSSIVTCLMFERDRYILKLKNAKVLFDEIFNNFNNI